MSHILNKVRRKLVGGPRLTTREKLADVLYRDLHIVVRPERLLRNMDTRGWGRNAIRWDAQAALDNTGVRIYSWDTMADCVKFGVVIQKRERNEIEITADKKA